MTNEQLEKAMAFILDQQAKTASHHATYEAKVEKQIEYMLEHQAKFDTKQEMLQEDLQTLTKVVGSLAMQIEADHQITNNSINALNNAVGAIANAVVSINSNIVEMRKQADEDRQAMGSAVDKLVNSLSNVHKRVSHLEDQAT